MDFPATVTDTTNTHLDFHDRDSNFTFSEMRLTSNEKHSLYYYIHFLTALPWSSYLFEFSCRNLSCDSMSIIF